jgi:hypothetical protein
MRSHPDDRDVVRSAFEPVRAPDARPERFLTRVARVALLTSVLAALAAAGASVPTAAAGTPARWCAAHEAAGRGGATAAPAAPAPAEGRGAPAPDPCLAPDAVVEIVLQAFARNDTPHLNSGVATAFSFASPANRAVLGSVDRLAELVRDDTYRPLLYHVRVARGAVRIDGERATQRVVVTALGGERVVYTFTLSRQTDGAYKGCWMTDGVTREPPSSLRAPQLAAGVGGTRPQIGLLPAALAVS